MTLGNRERIAALAVLAVLVMLPCACSSPPPPASPSRARPIDARDVLLITVDTLRYDATGFSGAAKVATPIWDRLAASGRVFTFAHAHAVVTLPSHASILTGLYPYQHGLSDNAGFALAKTIPSLATILKASGYATAAFGKWQRPGGHGDVTASHVAWKITEAVPLKTSPALVGSRLYLLTDDGKMTCVAAITGTMQWQQRLGGQFAASPVTTPDRVYCFDKGGKTTVLAAGSSAKPLVVTQLDEGCLASPAAVDGSLFLRGMTHLYRIGN